MYVCLYAFMLTLLGVVRSRMSDNSILSDMLFTRHLGCFGRVFAHESAAGPPTGQDFSNRFIGL